MRCPCRLSCVICDSRNPNGRHVGWKDPRRLTGFGTRHVNLNADTTARSPWRGPGAVLLVSCYELGHQPLGLAQPLGFLEQAGFAPGGLDISVEDFDAARVQRARFVGIAVPMHTALRLGLRVAELIRASHPSCHICFYGLYASINAEYLLQQVADSVIGGEYEVPLVALVTALEAQQASPQAPGALPAIEGVSLPGQVVGPALRRPPVLFPSPSRRSLPALSRYARLQHNGAEYLVGYVEASRGCLHTCRHCPIVPVYEGRFFIFPEETVLDDIRAQVGAGAQHITFGDPDFLNGPGHSLSILRAMHREFPHLTFDFTTKVEHILRHRALFPEVGALGCLFVISAVESFSDVVLEHLSKGHTRADALAALEIVRSAGITLRPSLVPFTPWITLDEYLEMFDIVESADLIDATDPVQFTIRLLIPPGSALLTAVPHRPAPALPFLGPLDQANFQYQWTHPDPRMDELHRQVSKAVEEAVRAEEDPAVTFEKLHGLALRIAGRPLPPGRSRRPDSRSRTRPPRLTEPWFCCAEPTQGQFRPLQTKGHGEV